jgi:hypothetical protein
MKNIKLDSTKERVRLWAEYFILAHSIPEFRSNLEATGRYYSDWHHLRDMPFDDWWKRYKYMFTDDRVRKIYSFVRHPNYLHVRIPLNRPVTEVVNDVKALMEEHRHPGFGRFEFTQGVLMQDRTLHENFLIYRSWIELNRPAINTEFITEALARIEGDPEARVVPSILRRKPQRDKNGKLRHTDDEIRQVRRAKDRAKKICENVSKGNFPGK